MKKQTLILGAISILQFSMAQDISQNQIPSVILNQFNSEFPKANDIEWEKEGDGYSVEFELNRGVDHEIWYNAEGKVVKHIEDVSVKDVPDLVRQTIKKNYNGYTIEDVDRITSGTKVVYIVDLDSILKEDLELELDANGKVLNKKID